MRTINHLLIPVLSAAFLGAGAIHAGEVIAGADASGAASISGADTAVGHLMVALPWSRPTPPVASTGAVYLTITNRGAKADRLVALSTPMARSAQIHESRMVDGMMQMRQLTTLECPPNATVKIEPGGLHIMLVGLAKPLVSGMDFPLVLRFQDAGAVTVQVRVGERE